MYRVKDGKRRIWEGSNLSLIKTALGRNNTLPDGAASLRAGLDKTWRWNWARKGESCLACNAPGGYGIIHPIWKCNNPHMSRLRASWKNKIRLFLDHTPIAIRTPMEEMWRNMEYGVGGEFACCGVFQPRYFEKLTRADAVLCRSDKSKVIKMIKEVGYGARSLLKLHSEINQPEKIKTQ